MRKILTDRQLRARVIAFYLPQYHPVEVNDKYWGKGFTEWRNVVKARPLFRGHYQPKLPADLGFYDLRIPEVREAQAELAMEAGVEGFCYWHYWFGDGKEVLEMPLDEVVRLQRPNFPFCIGWANHSWKTSTWEKVNGQKDECIFKQEYPGKEDNRRHFYRLLSAFKDDRYIKVDGKLLFVIYDIYAFPDFIGFKEQWNQMADSEGIPHFFFVSHTATLGSTSFDMFNNDIHIHFPEGAIKKDGPSAGIAVTLAILSALTNLKIPSDLAMTGEITLRGHVLEIGGLKEKSLGALRCGIKRIIIPYDNDITDLPKEVKENIKFFKVKKFKEVLTVIKDEI